MPYWKKQVAQPFFSQPKRGNIKQAPTITPHPEIVTKFMDNKGNLQKTSNSNNAEQVGLGSIFEKPKKEKKKPIPGIRMLKKLVHHKDPEAGEKKLKRIVSAIKRHIDDEYDIK
jgi:thiamine monophosphate synthase